jgi:hypothetical protein
MLQDGFWKVKKFTGTYTLRTFLRKLVILISNPMVRP